MSLRATGGTLTATGGTLTGLDGVFDFYVDSAAGSDAAAGTLAAPWQTLTKVNASTFTAGQRIGLKRGSVWSTELVVPSSGAAGNPIEIGAYGSGAAPLISGATTVASSWSVYTPSGTPTEVMVNGGFDTWPTATNAPTSWSKFQPGGSTVTRVASITGSGTWSMRITADASNTNASVSQNVTLVAGTTYTLSFKGRLSDATKRAGVTITIPSGTYAGYQLQPGGSWSTVATTSIDLTSTSLHTITMTFTMLPETATASISVKRVALNSAWAEFDDVSLISGVPAVPPVNTYQTTMATQPWSVSRNDVALAEGTSRDTLANRQFKWVSNVLYVRDDTAAPGTALYEVGNSLAHAVTAQGKSHLRIRDLAARHITGRVFRADELAHDTWFERLSVRHCGHSDQVGSYAGAIAVRNSDDCRVMYCTVYGSNNDGIHGWNAVRMKVLGNTVGVCNGPTSDSIQIDGGYYYDVSTRYDLDTEVAYNTCDQVGTNSPKGCIILIHDGAHAHHNTCTGGNFQVSMIGSRVRADHNTLIDNAIGESWGGAVQMLDGHDYDDMEVDHNLIINPMVGVRSADAGVAGVDRTNVHVHHNTIVLTEDSAKGISHEVPVTGSIEDNIIYGPSAGPVVDITSGALTADRNVYGPARAGFLEIGGVGYDTLAAWRTATSQDANSVTTDPALDADYLPTAGLLTAGHHGDE